MASLFIFSALIFPFFAQALISPEYAKYIACETPLCVAPQKSDPGIVGPQTLYWQCFDIDQMKYADEVELFSEQDWESKSERYSTARCSEKIGDFLCPQSHCVMDIFINDREENNDKSKEEKDDEGIMEMGTSQKVGKTKSCQKKNELTETIEIDNKPIEVAMETELSIIQRLLDGYTDEKCLPQNYNSKGLKDLEPGQASKTSLRGGKNPKVKDDKEKKSLDKTEEKTQREKKDKEAYVPEKKQRQDGELASRDKAEEENSMGMNLDVDGKEKKSLGETEEKTQDEKKQGQDEELASSEKVEDIALFLEKNLVDIEKKSLDKAREGTEGDKVVP